MTPLDELYNEMEAVLNMPRAEVMAAYNADSKEEIVELIREEILQLENSTYPHVHTLILPFWEEDEEEADKELERERAQTCLSQGLSRYC